MVSLEMQQQMFSSHGSISPVRRSSIFRTATIRSSNDNLYATGGLPCGVSMHDSSLPADVFSQGYQHHGGVRQFSQELNAVNCPQNNVPTNGLDLDLDYNVLSKLDSSKLFEFDPFSNPTNDSADTYVESFRLNSGASDEDDSLSVDESLFPTQKIDVSGNESKGVTDLIFSPNSIGPGIKNEPVAQPLGSKMTSKSLPARTEPRQGRRASTLVLADLERYYTQPLAEASRALGLSATMLKKVCRSFGIRRWPHRQLASIDRTIARVRQRLAVQERTHFYSLDGDCRASAALRSKVAQLEGKKDAICRLTSRGMSLHNVTKCKNPDKAILEELSKSTIMPEPVTHSQCHNGSLPSHSQVNMMPQENTFNSCNAMSWDFPFNPLHQRKSCEINDAVQLNFFNPQPMQMNFGTGGQNAPIKSEELHVAANENALLNFNDLNLDFDTPSEWMNIDSGATSSFSDGLMRSSSPWSMPDDPFNLFSANDCNFGNISLSDMSRSDHSLF